MTLARDQKRNLSLRRPSFWAKNRFEACGEGHFSSKTEFRSVATLVSRQKQDFAPKRGTFCWFRVHVGLDRGSKRRFRVHVPHKNTPGDHVALTLHGRPVTQTGILNYKEMIKVNILKRDNANEMFKGYPTPVHLERVPSVGEKVVLREENHEEDVVKGIVYKVIDVHYWEGGAVDVFVERMEDRMIYDRKIAGRV